MKWEYKKYNREYHKNPRLYPKKQTRGFDVETCDGDIFLICSNGRTLHRNGDSLNLDDILKFLTFYKFKNSYNFFYNMRFDIQSVLKLLSKSEIRRFYEFGRCETNGYEIKGVDEKFITITEIKNHKSVKYWDISSFLSGGLDKNAKKYLGDEKKENIDVQKFNEQEYVKDNFPKILKYCMKDCELTKRLSDYFINLCERANFKFVSPYSPAYLSQINFVDRCKIPTLKHIPHEAIKYALKSYAGGLFDAYKRGTWNGVNSFDINSAYPFEITKLKDVQQGYFKHVREISNGEHIDGWYLCNIKLEKPIVPFKKNKIFYPVGNFDKTYLTKEEINFIRSYKFGDVEVIDGWEFIPHKLIFPFKDFVNELYDWRKELKKDSDDLQLIIKIIMNSIYGKTIQSVTKKKKVDGKSKYFIKIADEYINYNKIKKYGSLFNPFWASQITANTRLKCLKLAYESIDDVIAIQTDSVTFANNFKPKNIKISDELGAWEHEIRNDKITILGTGIYQYHNAEKYTMRGGISDYHATSKKEDDLLSKLRKNKDRDKITLKKLRPITLKKSLSNIDTTKADCNKFVVEKKDININSSDKRAWDRDFSDCRDVLESGINSKPLRVDMI